jgi:hypothetical protein
MNKEAITRLARDGVLLGLGDLALERARDVAQRIEQRVWRVMQEHGQEIPHALPNHRDARLSPSDVPPSDSSMG